MRGKTKLYTSARENTQYGHDAKLIPPKHMEIQTANFCQGIWKCQPLTLAMYMEIQATDSLTTH